jgi:penicillin-binding protein 2
MRLWRRRKRLIAEVQPDEILIDASSNAEFDRDRFEGRIEQPLSRRAFITSGGVLFVAFVLLLTRAGDLQIAHGQTYLKMALENQLSQKVIIADRGVIYDRTGLPLAFNVTSGAAPTTTTSSSFASREYADMRGLAHVVGYAKPPAKDSSGVYYRDTYVGVDGAEKAFNDELSGQNGVQLTDTDAHGKVVAESVTQPQLTGDAVKLSVDGKVTQGFYDSIANLAEQSNFQGGAGVIMDVKTGEILAMTSYPEFSQNALEEGNAQALTGYNTDPHQPFLNRAVSGLYAPGSIVKPVVGAAALNEGVIDENKQILSTGSISLPNPYDKAHPSVFKDWRANGWVDVRHAIAVSSDVYFYEVGGGFEGQPGLGIERLEKYFSMFGFGQDPGLAGFPDQSGNIPTLAWKAKYFPADPTWRVGDTYHTAIGQYGMQVTPLQAVREVAAIANGGTLLTPTLLASSTPHGTKLPISSHALEVIREGMRLGVTEGIAGAVKFDFVHAGAKTGTAQVGMHNEYINSWMIGFYPYEDPKYAYAVVLERGPAHTVMGAPAAMGQFLLWLNQNAPQYLDK